MAETRDMKGKGFFLDETQLSRELGQTLDAERDVDWSDFLQTMRDRTPDVVSKITKKVLDAHPRKEAFQLFGVLTEDECKTLIEFTEKIGYQTLKGYNLNYRSNTRRIIYYDDLKEIIWERTKPFMTAEVPHKVLPQTWRVNGLNPQFRFCRYTPGQKFAPHYDGDFMIDSSEKSLYTYMIYLNGGFDGGATNFLSDSASGGARGRVLESLPPSAGMLLVFEHQIYHEGEELRSGVKYMMRSDLMYKLDAVKTFEETADLQRVQEAQELLALAEQREAQGKFDAAVSLYKKAYRLAPELEKKPE